MIYGIDFGNLKSRVAVTRRGGVDVILNEISQRDSASYISYGDKERFIGEKGFDQAVRNQKNTVNNIKRFLGMQSDCPTLEYEKSFLSCPIVAAEDQSHEMEFVVQYKGEKHNFRPQQCLAALLGKLHSFVELDSISNGGPPVKGTDCVISCPVYFTSTQRRALLQAVEIAGLHCMALMNEPTACALDYGIFKSANFPEFDEKKLGSVVLFADIGHSATTISAVSFWKTSMKMLGSVYNVNLGTREIDNILLHHFRKEICDKYKIDVFENSKARFRLLQAIEKMKVMLSANPVSNLNVECLMNDIDVSFQNIKREDLEEMIAERFLRPFEELCAEAQRTFESYISPQTPIEIIGGGSRMPSVKTIIAKIFGLTPSVTLVATESIAKGCAILAAMLSPKFKVRDYVIQDKTLWNVDLGYWAQNPSNPAHVSFLSKEVVNKVVPLFKKGEAYPKSLDITFERSEPFDLHYFYDESDGANCIKSRIGSRGLHLGHIRLGNIVSPALGNNAQAIGPLKVKVRFRMSFTGLIEIENAYVVQEYEENPENSKQGGTCEEKETGKEEKKSTKRKEARSEATREALLINCMDPETLQIAIKQEQDMVRADRLIFETLEAKNALEGYMYDNSSKLASGGELNSFTSPENIALFTQLSREYEEWLWGDGEDSAKDEYTDRLAKLQNIVEPSRKRYINAEYIPHEKDEFNRQLNVFQEKIEALIQSDATKEEIGWIKKEEIEKAEVVIMEARQWCEKEFSNYMQQSKYEIPQFTAETIKERMRVVTSSVQPIISRPRPNPTTSGKEPSATSGDSGEKAPDAPHETTQNAEVD